MTVYKNNIPQVLKDLNQWVLWNYEGRGGKRTKIPYQPNGKRAKSNDSSTWVSYKEAEAVSGMYDGIGFVFTEADDLIGVDLDNCLDETTGELKPWAKEILDGFDSYREVSPSGTGVKVFCRGNVPTAQGFQFTPGEDKSERVEVYSQGRYFTVTANLLPGENPKPVNEIEESIINDLFNRAPQSNKSQAVFIPINDVTVREDRPLLPVEKRFEMAKSFLDTQPGAVSGEGGHNRTFAVALSLVQEHALPADVATNLMLNWNDKCKERWSTPELVRKVSQVSDKIETEKYGNWVEDGSNESHYQHQEWLCAGRLIQNIINPVYDEPEPEEQAEDPGDIPQELLDTAPGVLKSIIQHIQDQSACAIKSSALAGALATVATLACRKVMFADYNTPINLYIVYIATSGTGKESPRRFINDLFSLVFSGNLLAAEDVTSDSAIANTLQENPTSLILFGEVQSLFESFGSKSKDDVKKTVRNALLNAWNYPSKKTVKPKAFADKDKGRILNFAHLNIMGDTTSKVWDDFGTESISDGLFRRMAILEDKEPPKPKTFFEQKALLQSQQGNEFPFANDIYGWAKNWANYDPMKAGELKYAPKHPYYEYDDIGKKGKCILTEEQQQTWEDLESERDKKLIALKKPARGADHKRWHEERNQLFDNTRREIATEIPMNDEDLEGVATHSKLEAYDRYQDEHMAQDDYMVRLDATEEAQAILADCKEYWGEQIQRTSDEKFHSIYNGAWELTVRLAVIGACAEINDPGDVLPAIGGRNSRFKDIIQVHHVVWADKLIKYMISRIMYHANTLMEGTEFTKKLRKLEDQIKSHTKGDGWITRRDLQRRSTLESKQLDNLLLRLVEQRDIIEDIKINKNTLKTKLYCHVSKINVNN